MKQRTVISVALAFLFVLILASAKVRGAMHQAYYSSTNQSVVTDLLALHPGQNRKTDLARAIANAALTDDRLTRQAVDPSSLVDYCITYPNDLLAHSLLARVALQPSSYSGNLPSWQKNVTLSLEASKRFGVLEPENWFWRLSECYAQFLLGNAGTAREVLLRSPAPSKYDDRKRACDVFLQDFSKGGFWGQSELARNSLVRGGQMDRYLQLTELRSNLVKEIPNQGEIDVLFAKIGCSQVQLKSFAGAFMGQQLICLSVQSKYGIIGDLEYEKEKAQEFRQFCGNFAERNSAALTTEERSIISQAWLSPQPVTKRVNDDLRELSSYAPALVSGAFLLFIAGTFSIAPFRLRINQLWVVPALLFVLHTVIGEIIPHETSSELLSFARGNTGLLFFSGMYWLSLALGIVALAYVILHKTLPMRIVQGGIALVVLASSFYDSRSSIAGCVAMLALLGLDESNRLKSWAMTSILAVICLTAGNMMFQPAMLVGLICLCIFVTVLSAEGSIFLNTLAVSIVLFGCGLVLNQISETQISIDLNEMNSVQVRHGTDQLDY